MSRWYRAYEGTVTDAKIAEAGMIAGVTRSVAIATWHALLESAAGTNDSGRFSTTARRISVILCEPPEPINALLDAFSELGMIASGAVTAWGRRQYESDSSTERSRRHRERRRSGDATLRQRCATAPETETETDSDADASGAAAPAAPPPPPSAIDLKAAVFAAGVPLLTGAGTSDRDARSMLGRWRRDHGDGCVIDALSAAQAETASDPIPFIQRVLEVRNGQRRIRDHNHRPSGPIESRRIVRRQHGVDAVQGNGDG